MRTYGADEVPKLRTNRLIICVMDSKRIGSNFKLGSFERRRLCWRFRRFREVECFAYLVMIVLFQSHGVQDMNGSLTPKHRN